MTRARIIAATGAAIIAAALTLQFVLIAQVLAGMGYGFIAAAWIFFSYFTMFANLFACAILARAAIAPQRGGERLSLCVASALVTGGLAYTLLMRPILDPHGWQNIADILLHYVTPALFVIFFLSRGANSLRWRDATWALILPVAYCVYALARGRLDGWWPYPFLDPQRLSWTLLATNIVGLGFCFWLCALGLIALARKTPRT